MSVCAGDVFTVPILFLWKTVIVRLRELACHSLPLSKSPRDVSNAHRQSLLLCCPDVGHSWANPGTCNHLFHDIKRPHTHPARRSKIPTATSGSNSFVLCIHLFRAYRIGRHYYSHHRSTFVMYLLNSTSKNVSSKINGFRGTTTYPQCWMVIGAKIEWAFSL